ncbi:protein-arginine deiminase (PAD) domain-containing protein [Hirsutella rhossiliensis]|uniref:Protein-arginine deiminase (PAD) domain-containing protein n=1 Tax=Hirsutella rhossiliensis TaxID=111463 RepID=A0A9P8MXS5_9HYPO|nr:protein-arginine deiminase (PAD) domain-containing protein [Hirsutella rhossiliensis]KAH0963287.1 protein-arginine deiminase (PAD) domain-containing protein [Hirsutella rhossiliensis]
MPNLLPADDNDKGPGPKGAPAAGDNTLGEGIIESKKLRRRQQDKTDTIQEVGEGSNKASANPVRRDNDILPLDAFLPPPVNGLPFSGSLYVSPKPWGPTVEDGKDIFEEAVINVYSQVGYIVRFVDDWRLHRVIGDIYCSTNTLREVSGPSWWQPQAVNTAQELKPGTQSSS